MTAKRDATRRKEQVRQPTGREYSIAYGGGILAAVGLGGVALALEWRRSDILVAGIVLALVYVPLAVTFLFGRSPR